MRTIAPAKINWTLEVLGRRDDGYHEIRSVMQTIDLCDELIVEEGEGAEKEEGWVRSGSAALLVEGTYKARADDLTLRAARALEEATGRELPIAIRLRKRIPVAGGLGGGSSDAAAVLRLVNMLYGLEMSTAQLAEVGARTGSDEPFFAYGGTSLVEGRGERVTPLPDTPETWLVLMAPPIDVPNKTKRVYAALTGEDLTDGRRTQALVERIQAGKPVDRAMIWNVFCDPPRTGLSPAASVFAKLKSYEVAIWNSAVQLPHVAGSGPALFTIARDRAEAQRVARELPPSVPAFVARTLGAAEATAIVE